MYVESNFDFNSARLKSLSEYATQGRFQLISTDLTVREVKANIHEHLVSAAAYRPAAILRNFTSPAVTARFKPLEVSALADELDSRLDDYLGQAMAAVVQIRPAYLDRVIDDYFARKPPFGTGKNKAEFPDALVLAALRDWSSANGVVAVISRDEGVKAACSESGTLIHFPDVESFLGDLNRSERRAAMARDAIQGLRPMILKQTRGLFEALGFLVDGHDGDVEAVTLQAIDFGDEDITVLALEGPGSKVLVEATIRYSAELTYPLPGTGAYDREEDLVLFQDMVTERVQRSASVELIVALAFDEADPGKVKFAGVTLENPDTILVETSYDEGWPFK